jgi:hypothetical protein
VTPVLEKPYISVSINPENIRFLHFTNGGHTRKSIMAAPMFLRIKRSIEKGRWSNILRENRYCELCQKNQIGDEYHYIFECTNLSEKRTSLLPKHLIERSNIIKFKNLMTSERKPILQKLCKFIRYINMMVCPPG